MSRLSRRHAGLASLLSVFTLIVLAGCAAKAINPEKLRARNDSVESAFLAEHKGKIGDAPVAFWHGPEDSHLAIAVRENDNDIEVFDAETGISVKRIGTTGSKPLQFSRPCGITVADNMCFVVERGNHRVQVLRLPDFTGFGMIGADRLASPTNVAVFPVEFGSYYVYVADRYVSSPRDENQYIVRFNTAQALTSVNSHYISTFGYCTDIGYIGTVTDMKVMAENRWLLVTERSGSKTSIRTYTLDGAFEGIMP